MDELYPQILTYINGVWRRRWVALFIAWVVSVAGWAVVATLPDSYSSSGRIYVDTESVLRPLLEGIAVEGDVHAEIEVMTRTLLSRPNLEKVARATDLDITATTDAEMERLIQRLRESTSVGRAGDNLFSITYEGPDPQQNKDIVQALITIFIERNLGDNRTDMDSARQFLDQQIQAYEIQLEEAEQRTARFKQQNLTLLPGDTGYHGRLERSRQDLARAEADLKEAITQRDVLRREMVEVPEFLEFKTQQSLAGSGPPTNTEVQIVEAEGALNDLLTVYTEQHPDVLKVRRRLEQLYEVQEAELEASLQSASLDEGEPDSSGSFRAANPLHDQLRVRLIEQEANVQVLQEKVRDAQQNVTNLEALASSVPIVEAEFVKLNRDYAVLKGKYQELLSRREAARISQDRENQADKVQFRIVDPPQVAAFPSGPNRSLFLVVVTVMSLGAGFGFAFLLTLISPTFSNARQISDYFGLPVVGVVRKADAAWQRSLRMANAAAFLLLFLTVPAALGVLLQVEKQVGLGRLDLASMNPGSIKELTAGVTETSREMFDRIMRKL